MTDTQCPTCTTFVEQFGDAADRPLTVGPEQPSWLCGEKSDHSRLKAEHARALRARVNDRLATDPYSDETLWLSDLLAQVEGRRPWGYAAGVAMIATPDPGVGLITIPEPGVQMNCTPEPRVEIISTPDPGPTLARGEVLITSPDPGPTPTWTCIMHAQAPTSPQATASITEVVDDDGKGVHRMDPLGLHDEGHGPQTPHDAPLGIHASPVGPDKVVGPPDALRAS